MENKSSTTSILAGLLFVAGVIVVGWLAFSQFDKKSSEPVPSVTPDQSSLPASTSPSATSTSTLPRVTVMADGLMIPWDMAFLPDDDGILVTERGGKLLHLTANGHMFSVPLPRPQPKGEGGLLGITLHPQFAENHFIYVYMTTSEDTKGTKNAVFRYTYENGEVSNEKTIISGIPGALYHDGGRLEFGPDGLLYITTGDAQTSAIAQDLKSLGGKLLRVTDEGGVPEGNPFGTRVYSYGHRNSQGLAWDTAGNLWSTEHGRSGVTTGYDELNLIKKGKNYGWPTIEGPATKEGMVSPVLQSGATDTWAPASLLFYHGASGSKLYWGGLRGEALYEVSVDGMTVSNLKEHFKNEFGRIRTVRQGPDGMFYVTTSNRDGRGTPKESDDKLIRVNPELL
jgi:glucose/arabinose dehydrogenase